MKTILDTLLNASCFHHNYFLCFVNIVQPNGRRFSAAKCYSPPPPNHSVAMWIPSFYKVDRGAFYWCPCCTPIPILIHYLLCTSTQMHRTTHSPIFNFLLPHRSFTVADNFECCRSAWPRCQHCSRPLTAPHTAALTSVPPLVAGQQGSWGCQLLFGAAEADMGEEVSNGIGRLGIIDFTSHILLCRYHHWLRFKYVYLHLFW